jgi:ribosomal protein L19
MKIKKIINKLDTLKINKNLHLLEGKYGDKITIIYCDTDPGFVNIRKLSGICLGFKKKGLSSKVKILSIMKSMEVKQIFFIHSPHFADLKFYSKA